MDMLTSLQEQIPPRVAPTEEDCRNSPTALRLDCRSDHCHPPAVPRASVFDRADEPGSSAASRSSKAVRMNLSDGANCSEQQRMSSSERDSMESHEDRDESRHRQPEDKTTRSCKRKLDLASLSLGSRDVTKAQDSEKKDPESPPPAKRWVIGPLFQSFKSKMASFTEIVMSPVRLFKPMELPAGSNGEAPPVTHESREDVDDAVSIKEGKVTPLTKLKIIQRLSFDTSSSDSEQNKVTVSQNGSEHQQDSIPEDDRFTEAVRATNVPRSSREEKQNSESLNPLQRTDLADGTGSIRTSLMKGSGSGKAVQELIVLCERKTMDELIKQTGQADESTSQDQPKKLRRPTPAIRKSKKGRAGMAKSVEKEGAIGTDQEEESPTVMQTKILENLKLVQTGKRRKVQVSDERLSTCNTGDVQMPGLNSCDSSAREMRASRSKREKDVRCTLVALDTTKSASIDLVSTNATNDSTPPEGPPSTWASSRTTRRCKNDKERKSVIAEDPAERFRSRNGSSDLKPVRRNDIRQAKRKPETSATPAAKKPEVSRKRSSTRRVKRAVDAFEDQGMSMSLTLKVGSGVDVEKEANSIVTCGITTKGRKTGEVVGDDSKPGPTSGSTRLKRSLSCPDITSLQHGNDAPSAPVSDETLCCPPSPLKKAPDLNVNVPSPFKRARRHTVCSVEIEREIAPLCLRKEVYPKWGSASSPPYTHTPSKSFASLVSCFLSSPLAFLSKKSSGGHGDDSGYGASSSDLGCIASSSPPSLSATSGSAFYAGAPRTPERSSVSLHCSAFVAVSMEVDEGAGREENEENEQPSAVSEEKALSDSEIKTDNKQVERRKVSSIRIRKTLPKPQYNLTPMGLPKAVRIKKKVFSVEEIYTNKNFSKPPEGRLETIFEVPLSRRDGSQSLMGSKRAKRFVKFPELGVTRKPRRPLVGGAGGGGAQRKAAGNSGTGRTRRGREEEALHLQDSDSLLCSKLNELDEWMETEHMVY